MAKKTVDARGQICPKPLIMTKKALNEMNRDDELTVLIDNDTSRQNVLRFLEDNGISVSSSEKEGIFYITTGSIPEQLTKPDAEAYCSPQNNGVSNIIVFKSNIMGTGSDELGEVLLKAFINTLNEIVPLPETLIFYNSGILLTVESSPVLGSLQQLALKNVNLLVCGTCVEYYGKKGAVKVGTISNMYTIMEKLSSGRTIIYP